MYGNLENLINQSLLAYHNYSFLQKKGYEPNDYNYINKLTKKIIKEIEKTIDKEN